MLRLWNLNLKLDKKLQKPIYLQITDQIIDYIKKGGLKSGDILPSSRQLANEWSINRNTITKAFDILVTEGWVCSHERKGLFVSANLPLKKTKATVVQKENICADKIIFPSLSFDGGLPDVTIAPIEELARAYKRIFNMKSRNNFMKTTSVFGSEKFRDSISKMLNQTRGMSTDSDQICITRGSQMALFLIAHTIIEKGDKILVENPGYGPAWEVFKHAGAELIPINVDEKGICIEEVSDIVSSSKIKAVYTTPHHQYPTTVIMSLDRRLKLVELSNYYGFTIIEDDYDSDFHFGQRPIAPISSLSIVNNIIYIGTLSKMISESLRIGYLVANTELIQKVGNLRRIIDQQGDSIMEQAVLELVESGTIKKHIRKASKVYKDKRDYLIYLIDKYLKDKVTYKEPEGGLALWLNLKKHQDLNRLNQRLKDKGVRILEMKKYSLDNRVNGIRLGYASISKEQMEEAVIILSRIIE